MSEENGFELSRALYKEIKNMNREQMQNVITNIYKQGAERPRSQALTSMNSVKLLAVSMV